MNDYVMDEDRLNEIVDLVIQGCKDYSGRPHRYDRDRREVILKQLSLTFKEYMYLNTSLRFHETIFESMLDYGSLFVEKEEKNEEEEEDEQCSTKIKSGPRKGEICDKVNCKSHKKGFRLKNLII